MYKVESLIGLLTNHFYLSQSIVTLLLPFESLQHLFNVDVTMVNKYLPNRPYMRQIRLQC